MRWPLSYSRRPSKCSPTPGWKRACHRRTRCWRKGPPNIELDFNEAVDAELADIELYDQEANLVATGLPESITDDTIVQASVPEIGDGVYVVVWRVPSADGHVVNGVFSFQVGVQSGVDVGALIDKVSGGATATSTVGRLDTAARLLALIGLIVVIGGGLLAVQSADSSPNRMLLWLGWVFLLVGSLGSFGLYGAKVVAGAPADAIKPSVWGKVVGSHTASVLLVRIVLVIAIGGMLLTFARRASAVWRGAALTIGVALVLTYSSVGHANAQHPGARCGSLIDAVHLAAISLWIGGLLMFAFGSSAWLTDPDSERIVRRFSVMSMVAVPVIVATGVAQTLKLAGNLDDVTSTSWGRTLLVKVAVVTVLVAIGGVSQWLLRNDGPAALKRNVLVEAVIGIAVVGLAAALVALPPRSVAASKVFTTTLTNQGVAAGVTVTPGRVGQNEIHLVITPPGGSISPVISTTVQAVQAPEATPVPAVLESIGTNHYIGTISLAAAGDWTLQITVEATQGQAVVLSAVVPIPGSG